MLAIISILLQLFAQAGTGGVVTPNPVHGLFYTGPGDVVSGAYAWWGLRCYNKLYTGNVADIWDAATGSTTETKLTCSGGTINQTINPLSTTCAVACRVKTLYDQSGNTHCTTACDVTQATNANRPTLTQNCLNGHLCATFTAANSQALFSGNCSLSASLPLSFSAVGESTNGSTDRNIFAHNGFHIEVGFDGSATANTAYYYGNGSGVSHATANDNVPHALNYLIPSAGGFLFLNVDGAETVAAANGNTSTISCPNTFAVGATAGTSQNFMQGTISEIGVWATGFTTAQRNALCQNQGTFYSLTVTCSPPLSGTQFYVSNSGNDSNNGTTPATAWQTISKVNSSFFNSGTTVSFNGGQTFTGGLVLTSNMTPGTFTINSYGVGQATISSGNSTACFTGTNVAAIGINNIACVGGGNTTNTTNGVLIGVSVPETLTGPTITNNSISGYGANCLEVVAESASSGWNGVTETGNSIHDCTGNHDPGSDLVAYTACVIAIENSTTGFGTTITNSNLNFSNNTVFNCTGTASSGGSTGKGVNISAVTTATASNNLIHDFGVNNQASAGPVGIVLAGVTTATISFNEIYGGRTANGDGEALDCDDGCTHVIFEYNYTHDNTDSEILFGDFNGDVSNDVQIRFNVFESHNDDGIKAFCGTASHCTNINIYNNTVSVPSSFTSFNSTSTTPASVLLANNIFTSPSGNSPTNIVSANSATGLTVTGNDYPTATFHWQIGATGYSSLGAVQTAGFEKVSGNPVGTTANPNLTGTVGSGGTCLPSSPFTTPCPNAYTLTTSSPAGKGNGLNLNSIYSLSVGTQDLYGNAVTNTTLPIGAAANK